MADIIHSDDAKNRLHDWLAFEGPWLRAALAAIAILLLAFSFPSATVAAAIASVICLTALSIAVGLKPVARLVRQLLIATIAAAMAGALLPIPVVRTTWFTLGVALLGLTCLLRYNHPYCAVRVRPRQTYRFAGRTYTLPDLRYHSSRIFFVRENIQYQLMEMAAYTDRFLAKHGIRYVICYGTLLGALRHGGPMPWDDDVDFTIYHPDDIRRMETEFHALAAEMARDGYQLFRHGDYWKVAPKGFWQFPVVDLYRAAVGQPQDRESARVAFGGLQLCAPDNPEEIMTAYYGPDCLTSVVFGIPFWDSGFVPAALDRVVPERVSNALSALYDQLFK